VVGTSCNSVLGDTYRYAIQPSVIVRLKRLDTLCLHRRVGLLPSQYTNRGKTCDIDGGLDRCRCVPSAKQIYARRLHTRSSLVTEEACPLLLSGNTLQAADHAGEALCPTLGEEVGQLHAVVVGDAGGGLLR
jgi:hypothetical protein